MQVYPWKKEKCHVLLHRLDIQTKACRSVQPYNRRLTDDLPHLSEARRYLSYNGCSLATKSLRLCMHVRACVRMRALTCRECHETIFSFILKIMFLMISMHFLQHFLRFRQHSRSFGKTRHLITRIKFAGFNAQFLEGSLFFLLALAKPSRSERLLITFCQIKMHNDRSAN